MRAFRLLLIIGGLFNLIMGTVFFSNRMLAAFFHATLRIESSVFQRTAVLFVPQDPVHLLLIHGFGAGALILGATLIYIARDPARWIAFILFDGVGRLVYATVMLTYVFRFSLPRVIGVFGLFEMFLGLSYVIGCFLLARS
jgi:hypothetical protein